MRLQALPLVLCVVLALPCCADSSGSDAPQDAEVTYYKDVSPIMGRYCNDCHVPGGIAPFALNDYATAKAHTVQMRQAVASGLMPPWLASDAGLPLRYSHKMQAEHRDALLRWIDAGAPAGDPSGPVRTDVPPGETVEPPRPDLRLDPGAAYLPNAQVSDDYRCLIVHDELPKDIYVLAGAISPDQKSMVHHVVLFEIPTAGVAKVKALLGQDSQPGYKCFGGAGADADARVIMAWAPGSVPARFPKDTALKVSKGSLLVMQVHYNLVNSRGAPDRSTALLEISDAPPPRLAQIWPIADPQNLYIKAGDPRARQTFRLDVWLLQAYYQFPAGDMLLYASAPHMHLLGHRQTVSVDGGPLLLEIPRWDFHWQLPYAFQQPYALRPQDTIVVECEFDNSPANQPLVDGKPQTPRDVRWGEGTADEMCLNFLYVAPAPPAP